MFLNRAGCRLIGLEAQKAVGTPLEDLYSEDLQPEDAWSRVNDEILPSILRGDGNWWVRRACAISLPGSQLTS